MTAPFLQLKVLPTLTADQQEQAVTWQAHLQEHLRPSANWSHTIVYFRPSTGYVTDRLVFYPVSGELLIYWSLSPEDDILQALRMIGRHLPALQLPDDRWRQALPSVTQKANEPSLRRVIAYWASPYAGDGPWQVRKLALPELYQQIDTIRLATYLNSQATKVSSMRALEVIAVSFQAYQAAPHPDDGSLTFIAAEKQLLVEVPLDIHSLPPLLDDPSDQHFVLLSSLLAYLSLQAAPDIPGLDYHAWLKALERSLLQPE